MTRRNEYLKQLGGKGSLGIGTDMVERGGECIGTGQGQASASVAGNGTRSFRHTSREKANERTVRGRRKDRDTRQGQDSRRDKVWGQADSPSRKSKSVLTRQELLSHDTWMFYSSEDE